MRRKTKKTIKKSRGLSKRKSPVLDLVIGALLANVGSKLINRATKDMIPMGSIVTPAAVAIAANVLKPPYSEGMVVGGALTAVSEAIRSYAPATIKDLLAGEDQYVIQGSESSDPLLGAQYLLGESEEMTNPLDNTDYVISGSANDPLD